MLKKSLLNYINLIYIITGFTMLFSSCSYKQNQVLFERNPNNTDIPASNNFEDNGIYKIKPEDILQVRNLQSLKFILDDVGTAPGTTQSGGNAAGQTYPVERDGTVALPVIGHVKVAGLTRYDAAKAIEELYGKKLIKDPIIEVKIINLKVTVFGEVKAPGNYSLVKDRTTLVEILGEAGGLTDKANEKRIKIVRGAPLNPQVTEINLSELESLSNPATILQNQDIIYVGQNKRAIRNEKIQNLSLIAQPALLLLNTALLLITLK
jgi:polysaccharide export outer membrane protein